MPTVILLDVSLSMCRKVLLTDTNDSDSIRNLAVRGLHVLLDHIVSHCRLENTALLVFSSLWEKLIGFTRDYEQIKSALVELDQYHDKTNILNSIIGVNDLVMEEWGSSCPLVNVILVTDGSCSMSALEFESMKEKQIVSFQFPCKLHVVCLSPPHSPSIPTSISFFSSIITTYGLDGSINNKVTSPTATHENQIHFPEQMTIRSISRVFQKIADSCYKTWKGQIHCGNLWSPITLFPHLEPVSFVADFEACAGKPSGDISVIGFMEIGEVSSPPVISRHLMFSAPMTKEQLSSVHSVMNLDPQAVSDVVDSEEMSDSVDPGKQPSVCVLLHGALKIEGMVAICEIGPNWYGMLYSWADSKKKFNLMLAAFNCTSDCLPWLGSMRNLGFSNVSRPLTQEVIERRKGKKSYHSQNTVVWIRSHGIQSDVQKVVRLAKRLPEKVGNFYKELSRVRKAAASFAFYDLLVFLAEVLEREYQAMAAAGNTEAAMHLQYAVGVLRSNEAYDVDVPPLKQK